MLASSVSVQAENRSGWSAYAAWGINYTFPGALRIGYDDWEYGLISQGFVGASKVFSAGSSTYTGFGIGLGSSPNTLGFYGSAGYQGEMFWGIGFRTEMAATAFVDGSTFAIGLLGFTYDF